MKYKTIQKEIDAIFFNGTDLESIEKFCEEEINNKTIELKLMYVSENCEPTTIEIYFNIYKHGLIHSFILFKDDFLIKDEDGNFHKERYYDFKLKYEIMK